MLPRNIRYLKLISSEIIDVLRYFPTFVENIIDMKCNLSTKVKELCKSKGIQQKDLAQRMGIAPESLSRAINGNPQLSTMENLANALGVEMSELFEPKSFLPSPSQSPNLIPIRQNFLCLVLSRKKSFVVDDIKAIPDAINHLKNIYEQETDYEEV